MTWLFDAVTLWEIEFVCIVLLLYCVHQPLSVCLCPWGRRSIGLGSSRICREVLSLKRSSPGGELVDVAAALFGPDDDLVCGDEVPASPGLVVLTGHGAQQGVIACVKHLGKQPAVRDRDRNCRQGQRQHPAVRDRDSIR